MRKFWMIVLFIFITEYGFFSHAETASEAFASRTNTPREAISLDTHVLGTDGSASKSLNTVVAKLISKFARADRSSIEGLSLTADGLLDLNIQARIRVFFFLENGTVCKIERQYKLESHNEHTYLQRCLSPNGASVRDTYFESNGLPIYGQ